MVPTRLRDWTGIARSRRSPDPSVPLGQGALPTMAPAGLLLSRLTRTFGPRTVVDNLSLVAAPGQVVGLLGPNGCGKSTTLKMLAGVLQATSGTFTLDGRLGGVAGLDVKRRTGFIPDVGGLLPRLSAWEHLELCARLFAITNWQGRALELLSQLDLTESRHESVGDFSHGMGRKLSAAIALLPAPALLLADEPFDGVDLAGITALSALLTGAAAGGAVVLVTTHLLGVAELLCDQVHLVKSGRVLAAGTPADMAAGGSLVRTYERVLCSTREDAGW